MKFAVESISGVSRSTRFISLNRARILAVLVLTIAWSLTPTSYAQQAPQTPPDSKAPGNAQGGPQGAPQGNPQGNAQGASNTQNGQGAQNTQNNSNQTQAASTHSVNVAGEQIAPFFQISTNANSPIVGEQLTILRLVYGIYSPAERSRRLVAYWELSGRHAYYNLCSVYLDFANQCSQKVESGYSSGTAPQETKTLLESLRLVAAQRCEDARLTFLQAQYDFDASFTSAAGRRAAMERAAYSDVNSKSIGWGSAVLYIPSAKPATDFYNSRFEENARYRNVSKEAARLNSLLPLLYESLQSRANQAIRAKDVLIGTFNASTLSETALFNALDRYFEAQRDALEAAIRYNQAIALYVAETTPGYVQGERFLATLNQRVDNTQGTNQNAPAGKKTNDAQPPQNAPSSNTSAQYAPRVSRQALPGLDYDEPTYQRRYTAAFRAPGMDRWYYPGFDDENVSRPQTFASDPLVDSVSDARVAGKNEEPEQPLVPPLASSSLSTAPTSNLLETSSLNSAGLQPAAYSNPESTPSANSPAGNLGISPLTSTATQAQPPTPESTNAQPPAPAPADMNAPPAPPTPAEPGAQPFAPAPSEPGASSSSSDTSASDATSDPAPEDSKEEEPQEAEKPHTFAFSEKSLDTEEKEQVGDDELLSFFEKFNDEIRSGAEDSFQSDSLRITRGQAPDSKKQEQAGKTDTDAQNAPSAQDRVAELARSLFAPSTPEQEDGRVVERTCSLAESLMRVQNTPNARFAVVDAYWKLQRASARLRVETILLATYTRAFNDANAANLDSARTCLAAALGAQARVAEAKSVKRSVQAELLRVSNQSADYGYPIPSTLPFFGSNYALGTPVPENVHTRRSGELIRSRIQGLQNLGASVPAPNAALSLDVESVADCDVLVALDALEKKRESTLLFIDSIIDLNVSIAEYVSFFPANASNEQFVEALVGRN